MSTHQPTIQEPAASEHRDAIACLAALVACVLSISHAADLQAQDLPAQDLPGWDLAWSDDFNGLDQRVWQVVDTNTPTNNSLQDYTPEQVTTAGGRLVITAEDKPSRGLQFRSGQVASRAEQRLGRWEVCAKVPATQGMWPAIWLLPDVGRYPWPTGGEIDILENRGNQPTITSSAFHYGAKEPFRHDFVYREQQSAAAGALTNYHDGFHVYAVEWREASLRFFVDGVHHYTVHDADVGGFLSRSTAPMRLMINNAIGGTFLPNPDASTVWPQRMEVDWVRVYTHNPKTHRATFENGSFERRAGRAPLAGWSTFGGVVADNPNISVAVDARLRGAYALKLFGDFAPRASFSGVSQGVTVRAGQRLRATLSAFLPPGDSIAGTDNAAILKIEFYRSFGAKFGSDQMLGSKEAVIADGQAAEDAWLPVRLDATVPDNATEARLSIVFSQPGQAGGAVYIDNVRFDVDGNAAARRAVTVQTAAGRTTQQPAYGTPRRRPAGLAQLRGQR
ncbi:MAG: glycoside hydrolase family 16 protein [Planctomycetota bacterium]